MNKRAGILLPLFSVPGNQGIGDLGQKTLMMIDVIADAGYDIWAMLPLSPSEANCPYQEISSYAGDPVYINIDRLAEMGLLTQSSIVNCNKFKDFVDYETVRKFKEPYFQRAFRAFRKNYTKYKKDFEDFKKEAFWLNAWTAYEVFRESYSGIGWSQWEEEYQNWPEKQEINLRDHVERVFYVQFLQFIFYKQLQEVVEKARSRGLKLMVDMPFFLNLDSAEVWAHKKDFLIQPDGTILEHAGTPPDAYFKEGQVWNRPVYDFDFMKHNAYRHFKDRFRWTSRYFDIAKILHFKAMDTFWSVPDRQDARGGRWIEGPGKELMAQILEENPGLEIVAEDLGASRPSLKDLEEEFSIPGMDVLQYRMETKLLKRPAQSGSVLYTSTQDTPTMEEDYSSYTNNKRIALRRFFKKREYEHRAFHDLVCHYALNSEADIVILNMPDVVGLKGYAAMNHTSVNPKDDWSWKLKDFKVFPSELKKTIPWLEESGRLSASAKEKLKK